MMNDADKNPESHRDLQLVVQPELVEAPEQHSAGVAQAIEIATEAQSADISAVPEKDSLAPDDTALQSADGQNPKFTSPPIAVLIANVISTDYNGRIGRDIPAAPELMKELDDRFYRDHVRSPASVLKPEKGTLVFALPGIQGTLVWRKLEPWWFADANLDDEADL